MLHDKDDGTFYYEIVDSVSSRSNSNFIKRQNMLKFDLIYTRRLELIWKLQNLSMYLKFIWFYRCWWCYLNNVWTDSTLWRDIQRLSLKFYYVYSIWSKSFTKKIQICVVHLMLFLSSSSPCRIHGHFFQKVLGM